ncbi:MAG TPA: helix-turn-helix domain-containing protein [Umezawaea sp.]|nr:helix-turn-helix domain-containing protein [Umezawaea sp.]
MLETARRLFAEHGYDGTSLQMIADAMGVAKANVYYYFRTKASILEAMLAANITALEAALDAAGALRGKRARREFLVGAFVDQVMANRSISPVSRNDPGLLKNDAIGAALADLNRRGRELIFGEHPTPDEVAAYTLLDDLGPSMRALPHLPDDELREVLLRLCLRVLRV